MSDYLRNFDKTTRKGECRSCSAKVSWNRKSVASHKRANCSNASADEKLIFAKNRTISDFTLHETASIEEKEMMKATSTSSSHQSETALRLAESAKSASDEKSWKNQSNIIRRNS